MSDELRYYFFDNEPDEHPSIPAEEGWKQMQHLLDTELPLPFKRKPRRYLFFITAALSGIIFLTTALPVRNYFEQRNMISFDHKANSSKAANNIVTKQNQYVNKNTSIKANTFVPQQQLTNTSANKLQQSSLKTLNSDSTETSDYTIQKNIQTRGDNVNNVQEEIVSASPSTDTAGSIVVINSSDKQKETASLNNKQKKSAKGTYKSWQLNAGIASNISLSNTLHALQPYPFAELRYQFTPRFFAGASIALFSPVGSHANGIKKTVYVNDTSSDVSKYNEKLNYKRLTYADVALTAGIKPTKQLSVQGGVQFSRLLNTTTNTTLDPYDFNMNMIFVQDVRLLPTTPSAAPIYNNKIEAQKFDIRYLVGINYDLKKISIGLQYQAGIKPVLKGDAVSSDKNKLITLKAAYRFK